jgi:hypothetical protein
MAKVCEINVFFSMTDSIFQTAVKGCTQLGLIFLYPLELVLIS